MTTAERRTVEHVSTASLRAWPLPVPGDDKESRGRTLLVGGHVETPGAIMLSAEAALRCGAGKLQVATVRSVATTMAVALPEALVRPLPETSGGDISPDAAETLLELATGCSSVLVGPGIGDVAVIVELLDRMVGRLDCALVLDAGALAFAREHAPALSAHRHGCVLTPNRKELALTLDVPVEEVDADPVAHALQLAERTGAVVSCGGAPSWVATPDGGLWCDESGGAGLGVSGSGDVMAGIVAGLLARGAPPAQAAVWASHLHGRAGERLAARVGPLGYLARELPAEVPRVLVEIVI